MRIIKYIESLSLDSVDFIITSFTVSQSNIVAQGLVPYIDPTHFYIEYNIFSPYFLFGSNLFPNT